MFRNILSNIAINQMFKIQDNFDLKSLSCRSKICDKFKEKTKTIWVKKHIKFIKSRTRKEAIEQTPKMETEFKSLYFRFDHSVEVSEDEC